MAKKRRKSKKLPLKTIAIIAVALAAIAAVVVLFVLPQFKKPGEQKVDTVSTLERVVKTSSLSTYETVYNGVSVVYNEANPEKVDYYVSYDATVKAGLDFNKIKFTKDDENHLIIVDMPAIELMDPNVKIEDMDYIFVNKKVNQDGISAKAYAICINDAKEEASKQDAILRYARQNAENLISGLITPFVKQMEEDYTISFDWEGK